MLLKSSDEVFDNSGKVMTVKGPLDPDIPPSSIPLCKRWNSI